MKICMMKTEPGKLIDRYVRMYEAYSEYREF